MGKTMKTIITSNTLFVFFLLLSTLLISINSITKRKNHAPNNKTHKNPTHKKHSHHNHHRNHTIPTKIFFMIKTTNGKCLSGGNELEISLEKCIRRAETLWTIESGMSRKGHWLKNVNNRYLYNDPSSEKVYGFSKIATNGQSWRINMRIKTNNIELFEIKNDVFPSPNGASDCLTVNNKSLTMKKCDSMDKNQLYQPIIQIKALHDRRNPFGRFRRH